MQVTQAGYGLKNNIVKEKQQAQGPAFKGARTDKFLNTVSKPLQAMDANPILAVILLDIATAILPNYLIDTFQRNPAQGLETLRRESSGLFINCLLPGFAVLGVAKVLKSSILGDEYKDVPAHRIWANADNITEGAETWKKAKGSTREEKIRDFVHKSFERLQPNKDSVMVKGSAEEIAAAKAEAKKAVTALADAIIDGNGKYKNVKVQMDIPGKKLNEIYVQISKAYGESKGVDVLRLVPDAKKGKTFSTGMKNYIRDTFSLARAFESKSVQTHGVDKLADKLKSLLKVKSGGTMAAVALLALSMHAINRKITEKTTGRKGYAGYKNLDGKVEESHEDKKKLTMGKVLGAGWFGSWAILSMGKPFAGMLNFAAPTTTMHQARALSLTTDVGRVAVASDKNELKDTMMRDTLIFLNLYVLGDYINRGIVGMVQKHYAKKGINANLINEAPKPTDGSIMNKISHFIRGKSVKTVEEIEGTVAHGISNQSRKNIVTAASLASLAYSMGALGILAPIMIAKITNKNRERQLAEAKARMAAGTVGAATVTAAGATIVNASESAAKVKRSGIKQASVRAPKFYNDSQG